MQTTKHDVLLVIPTFAPTRRVVELVEKLALTTIVSDDASPVTADPILRELREKPKTTVLRNFRNRGIARGLNQGLEYARTHGYEWLLTLDQDSMVDSDFARALFSAAQESESLWSQRPAVGVIAPHQVLDASGVMNYPTRKVDGLTVTEEVIQSGSLWRVSALTQIDGFDESLGIDAVDAAACLHLREAGYLVALTDTVELHHNLGDSRQVNLLGRTIMVTSHSPQRRATMVRNRVRLAPAEFRQSPLHAARSLRRVTVNSVIGGLTGEDRWGKTKGALSGLLPKKRQQ